MDDLRAALRPLVEEPSSAPPGLDEIAARAGRRRGRRRALRGAVAVVALAGGLGLAVPAAWRDEGQGVRVADAPATTPAPPATATTTPPDATAIPPDGDARPPTTAAGGPSPTGGDAPATTATPGTGPPAGPGATSPTTRPAPRPAGPHDPFAGIEAEDWGEASGVGAVALDDRGGRAVTAAAGAWLAFPDVRFGAGLSTAVEVVAVPGPAAGPGAVVEVRLDDVASPPFATIPVPAGDAGTPGDAGRLVTLTGATSAIGGTHDVYVTFASPRAGELARVDRLRFVP